MERHFEEELRHLREKLLHMAALTEETINLAVTGLKERNEEITNKVFESGRTDQCPGCRNRPSLHGASGIKTTYGS